MSYKKLEGILQFISSKSKDLTEIPLKYKARISDLFFLMELNISQWQNHPTHVLRNVRACGWNLKYCKCLMSKPLLQTGINDN